jgi:hypothetical protein
MAARRGIDAIEFGLRLLLHVAGSVALRREFQIDMGAIALLRALLNSQIRQGDHDGPRSRAAIKRLRAFSLSCLACSVFMAHLLCLPGERAAVRRRPPARRVGIRRLS